VPPLKHWGREKREEIREIIASGRGMPPLSPKTIENYERLDRGDKRFRKGGKIRAAYGARLKRETKRMTALKAWAQKTYGSKIPAGLQRKFANFDKRMAGIQKKSAKLQAAGTRPLAKVGPGPMVDIVIIREKSRKRARIVTPGFDPNANVAFPRELRKVGAKFSVSADAITKTQGGYYRVKPSGIQGRNRGGELLGQVPNTLYAKTAKQGKDVLLVVGSRWRKDGIHNEGDGHVPQRLHIELTGGDVERLKSLIARYSLKPLRGAA
jgi:hypothetical protein